MEMKKLIGLIVTCFIGIILIGSLLSPVIDAYGEKNFTIENTGMPYTEAGGDHIITITSEAMTLDGDAIDMTMFPGNFTTYTIVYGEESFIRWGSTNIIIVSDSEGLHSFTVGANTITITLSDNTAVMSTSGSATTYTIDDVLFYVSPSGGDYILALNPYVTEGDVVYAAGDTYYTATGRPAALRIWTIWTGLDGEVTVVSCGTNSSGYTSLDVTNVAVDYQNIESNLYRYNSVVFNYTTVYTDDQEATTDVPLTSTYTYFLAPATVTYDNPTYLGDEYAGILAAVIVIALAAMLILVVRFITAGRD